MLDLKGNCGQCNCFAGGIPGETFNAVTIGQLGEYLLLLAVLHIEADSFPLHVTISSFKVSGILRILTQPDTDTLFQRLCLLKWKNLQWDCTIARIQISKLLYIALTPGLYLSPCMRCIYITRCSMLSVNKNLGYQNLIDMNVHSLWPSELKGYSFYSQLKHLQQLHNSWTEILHFNSRVCNTRRELSYLPSKKTPCHQGWLHTYSQHKSLHFLSCCLDQISFVSWAL